MWAESLMILGSYLLGSFPLLYLLGRLHGVDLREEEDMHIALWRKVGRLEGGTGLIWDVAKGAIAVLIARSLGFEIGIVALAGLAAVGGQMWSVFLRFEGEKGNTTGLAMAAALAPKPLLVALVPILLGATIRTAPRFLARSQSLNQRLKFGGPPSLSLPLGMAIGFGVMPLAAWWLGQPPEVSLVLSALFLFIIAKRLTAGLGEDLKEASSKRSILINRLLYDRSYR